MSTSRLRMNVESNKIINVININADAKRTRITYTGLFEIIGLSHN